MSLRDVQFLLECDEPFWNGQRRWSLLCALRNGTIWPPLKNAPGARVSLREVYQRFAGAGAELRKLARDERNVWPHVNKDRVVRELRNRVRDPAVMRQNPTDLCGPMSLMMEFARRRPARFVRGAAELLREGALTAPGGLRFEAAGDLRARQVPAGDIAEVEWVYAATMRDASNISDDIDDAEGFEGLTWPWELVNWTQQFLGLRGGYISCIVDGELEALRAGQRAVERGGVAFLLVEADLIHDGDDDDDHEENVWWRRRRHRPGGGIDNFGDHWTHSVDDDNVLPDHYVVLLGRLEGATEGGTDFKVRIWSFGHDYEVKGSADGFGEYLYGVVTGTPET